jgi:hypothetical protein
MRELFLSNLIGTGKKRFGIYFDGNAFEYYQLKKPKKTHSTRMLTPLNIISKTILVMLIIFKGITIQVEWLY